MGTAASAGAGAGVAGKAGTAAGSTAAGSAGSIGAGKGVPAFSRSACGGRISGNAAVGWLVVSPVTALQWPCRAAPGGLSADEGLANGRTVPPERGRNARPAGPGSGGGVTATSESVASGASPALRASCSVMFSRPQTPSPGRALPAGLLPTISSAHTCNSSASVAHCANEGGRARRRSERRRLKKIMRTWTEDGSQRLPSSVRTDLPKTCAWHVCATWPEVHMPSWRFTSSAQTLGAMCFLFVAWQSQFCWLATVEGRARRAYWPSCLQ